LSKHWSKQEWHHVKHFHFQLFLFNS
jgi:hypothetical protein